jgi:hypothetical protein
VEDEVWGWQWKTRWGQPKLSRTHLLDLRHRDAAPLGVGLHHRDDWLLEAGGRHELAHAVGGLEVGLGAVDDHRPGGRDVLLEHGELRQVVDVEEDLDVGQHLEHGQLYGAVEVLPRDAPDV